MSTKFLIPCDGTPIIPANMSLEESDQLPNRIRGIYEFDPAKTFLYMSEKQKKSEWFTGNDLCKELNGKRVLPIQVLHFLFKEENRQFIPYECRRKDTYFWGSILRSARHNGESHLMVPVLLERDGNWYWHFSGIGNCLRPTEAAICAR